MATYKRSILAAFNDLQCGSALGIANPKTLLSRWDEDGNQFDVPIQLNAAQNYLWPLYTKAQAEIVKLAGKDDIHVLVNGDMTQGGNFDELDYPAQEDQVQIAADVIGTWMGVAKNIRLTKSTRVHAYRDGGADKEVLKTLRHYKKADVRLVSHGQAMINGAPIDYAHHGPPGGVRTWLKGNLMRYYAKSLIDNAIKDRRPVPKAILRAHKHERIEEWLIDWRLDERIKCVAITVPSFQLMTSHAQKVTNSEAKVTNGMVALEIINGEIKEVHWFAQTRYMVAEETL